MAERSIVLDNYRDLGIDKPTSLVLNNSVDKDNLGGLVVLVGPNNSGKSNVLSALLSLIPGSQTITKEDRPDFITEDVPDANVSFVCKDGNDIYSYSKNSNGQDIWDFHKGKTGKVDEAAEAEEEYKRAVSVYSLVQRYFSDNTLYFDSATIEASKRNANLLDEKDHTLALKKMKEFCIAVWNRVRSNYSMQSTFANYVINKTNAADRILVGLTEPAQDRKAEIGSSFEKKYGYSFLPTISLYNEQKMRNNMLNVSPNSWTSSPLFVSLFNTLGIKQETIATLYQRFQASSNISVLTTFAKKYQAKVDEIAERFNKLYFLTPSAKYSFELIFSQEHISFGIKLGDTALNFEKQSTGFQWFFDLFFNYMNNHDVKPGDILVMDEPGTCLHVRGQEELRDFLEDFAIKHDITIVISTHSPFLVAPDHFDEVRVVSRDGNEATIKNDFHVTAHDYPDTLSPVTEALTTRNSVVVDPNERKIFVEGITDYDYLTAFKIALGVDGLVFLPINGLGKKGCQDKIIAEILKLEKEPNLLVDGDIAGIKFQENGKDTGATIIKLTDVDPSWKEMENLFTDEERAANNLDAKKGYDAALFKSKIIKGTAKISAKTKENFKKLLDYLSKDI